MRPPGRERQERFCEPILKSRPTPPIQLGHDAALDRPAERMEDRALPPAVLGLPRFEPDLVQCRQLAEDLVRRTPPFLPA